MNIFYGLNKVDDSLKGKVITIGSFDGIHKGHKKVLENLSKISKREGKENLVITFEPHPRIVLEGIKENFLLTTLEDKLYMFETSNLVDNLLIIPFDKNFAQISADDFVEKIIINRLAPSTFVVGYDTHFGNNRKGDIVKLRSILLKERIKFELVEPEVEDAQIISSSIIRKFIKFGNIEEANKFLGYKYFVKGVVVRGEGRGAILGFPTANIEFDEKIKIMPQNGVYAVLVIYEGKKYKGMMNVGKRPTFDEKLSLEVHILDFNENLYNKTLKIHFIKRLRDEVKFPGENELIEQLKKDKEEIKNLKEELWL
ncbi:MAG: bifunctional riboflavin kinase/FAD synthetase [candidate division WOR-3 bacterium]